MRMALRYRVLVQEYDLLAVFRSVCGFSAVDLVAQPLDRLGVVKPVFPMRVGGFLVGLLHVPEMLLVQLVSHTHDAGCSGLRVRILGLQMRDDLGSTLGFL